jgi:hypothetical protein
MWRVEGWVLQWSLATYWDRIVADREAVSRKEFATRDSRRFAGKESCWAPLIE